MDKKDFAHALKELRTLPKKNFAQSVEFIAGLTGLNLKKPEEHVELWVQLPHGTGKKTKICALIGPELLEQAKQHCDGFVLQDDFSKYTAKKDIKKLASQYDYFIAQANIMPDVAKAFGRYFGPRGRMPNPKAGCVVPPNANLGPLVEKLRITIKIQAKTQPNIQTSVGTETMSDEELTDNIQAVYSNLVGKLPQEQFNIKNVYLKLSMSKPIKIVRGAQ